MAGFETTTGSGRIRACVERILASEILARSDRLRRFIRFTVDETLAGRTDRIKETTIALEAYGRRPASYNPKVDAFVRAEARRHGSRSCPSRTSARRGTSRRSDRP